MKPILTSLFAATVALTTTVAGIGSAVSAPLALPRVEAPAADNVVNVQQRRGFYRDRGNYYYNGHRGHRERRAGWRQHQGYWFPPAAFALGAIIGGAIANDARPAYRAPAYRAPVYRAPVRLSQAHLRWCENRWRSYRASDNSYQPINGPRRACVSPYS